MSSENKAGAWGVPAKLALAVLGVSLGVAMMYYPRAEPFIYPDGHYVLAVLASGEFALVDRPVDFSLQSKYDKTYRLLLEIDGCTNVFNDARIDLNRPVYDIATEVREGGRVISSKKFDSRYRLTRPDSPDCRVVLVEFNGGRNRSYDIGFVFRAGQEGVRGLDGLTKKLWVEESFPDAAADAARVLLVSILAGGLSLFFLAGWLVRVMLMRRRNGEGA